MSNVQHNNAALFYCEQCCQYLELDERSKHEDWEQDDPICKDCYEQLPSEEYERDVINKHYNNIRGIR